MVAVAVVVVVEVVRITMSCICYMRTAVIRQLLCSVVLSCLNEYIAVATFFFANAHVQKSCYMLYMLCNVLIGGMTKLC